MPTFLIIEPNSQGGRGARGRNLAVFLSTYFGSRSVKKIHLRSLNKKKTFSVDHLLLGIPSHLTKQELSCISYKSVHLFDYEDNQKVIWGDSDEQFLRTLTNSYLKTWKQKNWDEGFSWGTLPIRRSPSLPFCFIFENWRNKLSSSERIKTIDTTFLGNPLVDWKENYSGKLRCVRMQWLDEIANQNKFSFSGGFFIRGEAVLKLKNQSNESLKKLFLNRGRINFISYFNQMLAAKTALAPPGNALWSYRHYESIYAGCIPITADFREAEMLVPLPLKGMIHLINGESVLSGIEEALKLRKENSSIVKDNLELLESYLTNGMYDKKKKRLINKFMKQIEEV